MMNEAVFSELEELVLKDMGKWLKSRYPDTPPPGFSVYKTYWKEIYGIE